MFLEKSSFYIKKKGENFVIIALVTLPVAEFSVSICSTPKFICSSDDGVPRLLNTDNYMVENNTIRCKKLAIIVSDRKTVARPFVRRKQLSTNAEM